MTRGFEGKNPAAVRVKILPQILPEKARLFGQGIIMPFYVVENICQGQEHPWLVVVPRLVRSSCRIYMFQFDRHIKGIYLPFAYRSLDEDGNKFATKPFFQPKL